MLSDEAQRAKIHSLLNLSERPGTPAEGEVARNAAERLAAKLGLSWQDILDSRKQPEPTLPQETETEPAEPKKTRRPFGKWAEPGVPHTGWTCVRIKDLEEPCLLCEMCEFQTIRFVHWMSHPDYPKEELGVGCECAAKMEGDAEAPKAREREMQNAARRRRAQEKRAREERDEFFEDWENAPWRRSAKGNLYKKVLSGKDKKPFLVVIFQHGGSFRITVEHKDKKQPGRRDYASAQEAKNAASGAVKWAYDRWNKEYSRA